MKDPVQLLNSFVFENISTLNKLMEWSDTEIFLVKFQVDLQYFEKNLSQMFSRALAMFSS